MSGFGKKFVRRVVFATAVPPVLYLYRGYYHGVTWMVLAMLRKFPEIRAVYLRRGAGDGQIVPFISDLDFGLFAVGLSDQRRRQLLLRYARLARWTSVLDHFLEIYDVRKISELYDRSGSRYRLMEGRETWRLLYGKPYMQQLPRLALGDIQHALYREMVIWWTVFAWQQIRKGTYFNEPTTRNAVCYKATAEVLKTELGLLHQRLEFNRPRAMATAAQFLGQADAQHTERLRQIGLRAYRGGNSELPQETLRFLLRRFDAFTRAFPGHKLARPVTGVPVSLDTSGFASDADAVQAGTRRLLDHVRRRWADSYRGAALVGSYCLDVGERALMIGVDAGHPPSIAQLRELYDVVRAEPGAMSEPEAAVWPRLYVHFGGFAVQLDVDYYERGWISVLFPESAPDVFSLLADPANTIDGTIDSGIPVEARGRLAWTHLAQQTVDDELTDNERALSEALRNDSDAPRSARFAWKVLQYRAIQASVAAGGCTLPLTRPAVLAAASRFGVPVPDLIARETESPGES